MRYKQLTQEERYQISALMKAGHTQSEIAMILGRHKSPISREVRRNTGLALQILGRRVINPNIGSHCALTQVIARFL